MYHVVAYPFKSKVVYMVNNYYIKAILKGPTLRGCPHMCIESHHLTSDPSLSSSTTRWFSSVEDISNLPLGATNSTPGKIRLNINLASSEGARKTELRRDSLDTMSRVNVLDQGDLVAGGGALTGDDGGGGKEEFPDLYVSLAIIQKHPSYRHTRNHLLPYLATTFSLLPIQFRYHLQRVAE